MEWVLVPLGAFAMISWIIFTVVDGIRRSHQQRMLNQFQTKLLDRIGSVSEFSAFLNTEAGIRFLNGLTTVAEATARPHARILTAVQSGAVLATLGMGLYLYGWLTPAVPGEVVNGINAVATIFFAIGVGLLVSAALSYGLSKRLGLLAVDRDRDEAGVPTL
jgi:hypothetical protein